MFSSLSSISIVVVCFRFEMFSRKINMRRGSVNDYFTERDISNSASQCKKCGLVFSYSKNRVKTQAFRAGTVPQITLLIKFDFRGASDSEETNFFQLHRFPVIFLD